MNILLFEWDALMQQDLENVLNDHQINFRRFSYSFANLYEDDFFESRFANHLKNHKYDAVFSFNYFPLVSQICFRENIKYISWNYDSPVRLSDYSTFSNPTNIILMFDKKEASHFQSLGFQRVFHMPLAVYPKRLNQITLSNRQQEKFGCEVSFIGNLHHGNMEQFLARLPEYEWGVMQALVNSQMLLTSIPVTDLISVSELLDRWNPYFREYLHNKDFSLSYEDFLFLFGQYISETERKAFLCNFGKQFVTHVYSNDYKALPKEVIYRGTADYYNEMPYIFKASKINLNPTFRCIHSGISLRVLDILGAGGFLLTNGQEELFDYFENGKDLMIYEDLNHSLDLAEYILSHESERLSICENGKRKCQKLFSYDVILPKILRLAGLY